MDFMKYPTGSWFNRQDDIKGRINLMSQEKLDHLLIDRSELRPADDPAFMQLLQLAKQDPQDVDIQEMLAQKMAAAQQAYEASGDPFWGNMPSIGQIQSSSDYISVGKATNGVDMGLRHSDLSLNVLIPGPTGSGKTTTLMAMLANPHLLQTVCIVMMVKKPEWREFSMLSQLAGLVHIFQLSDMAISFGQPPDGVPLAVWHNDLSKIAGQNYERFSAHRLMNESQQDLSKLFPQNKHAALSQVIAAIEASKVRFISRRADLKESIVSCLRDLQLSVGNMFEYSHSTFLDELFLRPGLTVIEAMTLPPEHLSFLTTYLTRWIYLKRLYDGSNSMPVVFIIDDATVNVCQARDNSNPGGIAPIPESMVMGRALNLGYILLVHDYSSTSSIIRQNSQTLIIKGFPGESNYVLKNHIDLTEEQIPKVKTLPREKAVIFNRGMWPKPVLISIEKPDIPQTCPDILVRQAADAFLSRVKTTPPYPIASTESTKASSTRKKSSAASPTSASPAVNTKELEFLKQAGQVPPLPLSGLYKKIGLSNTEGRRVVNKLVSLGLIVLHSLASGRRGGRIVLAEPTDAAWTLLEQNGHRRPKDNGQGSWLHKITAELIGAEGKSQKETVTFEVTLDGCRIDVLRVNPTTHLRTFWNIGLSTPDYEAMAIIKFFATAAAAGAHFVLVTETAAFAQKVMDCLKQTAEGKSVLSRFTSRLIGSFVDV